MDKILAFSTKHEIVQYYCFPKSELGLNKTLSLSKTDRRHIQMVYRVFFPLCRKVLKMTFWKVPSACMDSR